MVKNIVRKLPDNIAQSWRGTALGEESSLHQLAPYIGKMKSSMAGAFISNYTRKGDYVYDPFCGCATVAFEAWAAHRNVIAVDLNPYAYILTHAKLFPCMSQEKAVWEINKYSKLIDSYISEIDLRKVPRWVKAFFHPDTLRETIAWSNLLLSKKSYFLLSCLLSILHHQRPGFLSYPSSHTIPYLRSNKFPRQEFPELYEYRPVKEKLLRKVLRALKRVPCLDNGVSRKCYLRDASNFVPRSKVNAIITSPPYMRQLDYARDNRLRLWFAGSKDWKTLDSQISPSEDKFLKLFDKCLNNWKKCLVPDGLCILVLGDVKSRTHNLPLPEVVANLATKENGSYTLISKYTEEIPNNRRVRRGCSGSLTETILVLKNKK